MKKGRSGLAIAGIFVAMLLMFLQLAVHSDHAPAATIRYAHGHGYTDGYLGGVVVTTCNHDVDDQLRPSGDDFGRPLLNGMARDAVADGDDRRAQHCTSHQRRNVARSKQPYKVP